MHSILQIDSKTNAKHMPHEKFKSICWEAVILMVAHFFKRLTRTGFLNFNLIFSKRKRENQILDEHEKRKVKWKKNNK